MGRHKKTKEVLKKECLTCNKKFIVTSTRPQTAKYCSFDCFVKRPRITKLCSVDGCFNKSRSNNLCTKHYSQYKTYNGLNKPRNNEERNNKHREYSLSDIGRYRRGIRRAKDRKLEWNISFDDYVQISNLPCYYCNEPILHGGARLDRIDNSKGYKIDNVLPACSICNQTRSDRYTVEEVKIMINALMEYRNGH